jgi:hypothetical protein
MLHGGDMIIVVYIVRYPGRENYAVLHPSSA